MKFDPHVVQQTSLLQRLKQPVLTELRERCLLYTSDAADE